MRIAASLVLLTGLVLLFWAVIVEVLWNMAA